MYSLYLGYKKFKKIVNNYKGEESLDLSNENFIAPTTMIPLLNFADKNDIKEFLVNPNTKDYVKRILNREETSTTIPYERLPFSAKERSDRALSFNTAQKINSVYGTIYINIFIQ